MALWQLVNLGTRCTVTHCRIALWSHQSAKTASSERCIVQIVNVSLRDSPPNPYMSAQQNISGALYIYFARRGKSLVKNCRIKKTSFDLLSFEGKRIDVGANKPKLRRFEIRASL